MVSGVVLVAVLCMWRCCVCGGVVHVVVLCVCGGVVCVWRGVVRVAVLCVWWCCACSGVVLVVCVLIPWR